MVRPGGALIFLELTAYGGLGEHRDMAHGRLVRSRSDRVIAGVAGGLAHHFDVDPTLVRVLWVLAVVVGGFGVLAYVILWVVLPSGDTTDPRPSAAIAVAEERYARGEITSEELARIREDLHT